MSEGETTGAGSAGQAKVAAPPEPIYLDDLYRDEHLLAVIEHRKVVAVHAPGFRPPWSDRPRTFDWRYPVRSLHNDASVRFPLDTLPLATALATSWDTEAYGLQYLVRHEVTERWSGRGMRVAADALDWLETQGFGVYVHTILVDIDNVGAVSNHEDWTLEHYEKFLALLARNPPSLARAGLYTTGRGWRVVQPLSRPVPVAEFPKLIMAYFSLLWRDGINPDEHCTDWQHLYRMPRTRRGETGRRDDVVPTTTQMVAVDPDAILAEAARHSPVREPSRSTKSRSERAARAAGKNRRHVAPSGFVAALPPWWIARAKIVAEAIVETPASVFAKHSYHGMYLCLAGALCHAGVEPELIPAIVHQIAVEAKSVKPGAHRQSAQYTVSHYAAGNKVAGRGRMGRRWPDVTRAFSRSLLLGRTAETREHSALLPDIVTVRKTLKESLELASRGAGPVLVKAPPGTGKTRAAYEIAVKNLPQADRSDGGSGIRAALSFDKNRLAAQTMNYLTREQVPTRRYRSPLSVLHPDGSHACALYDRAVALQRGGYSVTREFCHGGGSPHGGGDPHAKQSACAYGPLGDGSCVAYGTWEQPLGAGNPDLALANHALVIRCHEFLEEKGWLVIDEPPSILQSHALAVGEIERALRSRDAFDPRRVDPVVPALLALRAWALARLEAADDAADERVTIGDALADGCERLANDHDFARAIATARVIAGTPDDGRPPSLGDVVAAVRAAFPAPPPSIDKRTGQPRVRKVEPRRVQPPALRRASRSRAMHDTAFAARVGAAAHVVRLVAEAVDRHGDPWLEATVLARDVPDREGVDKPLRGAVVYVTMPQRDLIAVLRRPGPVALLDANAELHRPLLRRLFGCDDVELDKRTIRALAREAAMVERVWWKLASANRRAWFVHGRPVWSAGIATALQKSLDWANRLPTWCEEIATAPLCLITYHSVELGIRFALAARDGARTRDHAMFGAWKALGLSEKDAEQAVEALADVVGTWKGPWILGHYGAVRGMDDANEARTYIALGAPWPSFDDVQAEAAWLGVNAMDRWVERCMAELEQVFGRSRSACRVIFLRMLCVGSVMPSGEPWNDNDVYVHEGNDPVVSADNSAQQIMEMREEMGLSQEEMAHKIGISRKTMIGYEKGVCHIPGAVLSDIIAKWADFKGFL
jgi:hypothetical protein